MKKPTPLRLPEPTDFIPLVIRVHNNLVNAFERRCGIHLARWRLMFMIGRLGTCSQSDLARQTTIAPAAVTRILKDLEQQGLVSRKAVADDNRQLSVSLTEKGRTLVLELAARRTKFVKAALNGLSMADVTELERMMRQLQVNLSDLR